MTIADHDTSFEDAFEDTVYLRAEIGAEVPDASDAEIAAATSSAIRKLATEARAVTALIVRDILPGVTEYRVRETLDVCGWFVGEVIEVYVNGARQTAPGGAMPAGHLFGSYVFDGASVHIDPQHHASTAGLRIIAAAYPELTTLTLPFHTLTKHHDTIKAGALAVLYGQSTKPWADSSARFQAQAMFTRGIAHALAQVNGIHVGMGSASARTGGFF